jgi:hypothetical protein
MRRITHALAALVLAAALATAANGTAGAAPSDATPGGGSVATFCRTGDRLLRFIAHAPDPRGLNTARGRRVLDALHRDAPAELSEAAARVTDSFRYLSRHGRGSLSKQRDSLTGIAMLRLAVYGSQHCRQVSFGRVASALASQRFARAQARLHAASTTTTTGR